MADFLKNMEEEEVKNEGANGKNKYKDILSIVQNDKETVEEDGMEMEITWEPGNNQRLDFPTCWLRVNVIG